MDEWYIQDGRAFFFCMGYKHITMKKMCDIVYRKVNPVLFSRASCSSPISMSMGASAGIAGDGAMLASTNKPAKVITIVPDFSFVNYCYVLTVEMRHQLLT